MKKILFTTFFVLVLTLSTAFAAPFVVSDPQPGATKIILLINGLETPQFPAQPDGSILYDLVDLAEGDFIIKAMAGNLWGWSGWSLPLEDTKVLPNPPKNLRVSGEPSGGNP